MFLNHLAHRRGKMDPDEEIPDTKDASRPFLTRNTGEVGIYIDPIDAQAVNPKEFGLEHCFMMSVRENLLDHLSRADLVKVKGALEHRGLFKGVILEGIRKGMILIVTFDDLEALESLWRLWEKDKLSALFQELFVTKETMKQCAVTRLTIRAKMWEDEYADCKEELLNRSNERVSIAKFPNDIKILKEIRDCQKQLGEDTTRMRDLENDFELNLDDFMICVKRILPDDVGIIQSLADFRNSVKIAKGIRQTGFESIDIYLETLDVIGQIFEDVETTFCYRLSQIHGVCETEEQKDKVEIIKATRKDMEELLKPDNSLLKVRFKDWELKINPREKKLFLGLISLVPIGLERLIDIDHYIDEFITAFPEQIG
ncbi:uncharacterized protein LOC124139733 isoform X2 [Haliotis rufescens]|uniref:uncharacterized protein LOC124139733 isoform X2 n=1 Tax=Haliotis rufescens TaxID=6454 RepID=UPI00201F3921|nr:uncharacterized protein LOC124139733 isoform X2 [Haliotis rufescens]